MAGRCKIPPLDDSADGTAVVNPGMSTVDCDELYIGILAGLPPGKKQELALTADK